MTRVLFVCLGNICRSPTAEAVFLHVLQESGLTGDFQVDSAGILSVHEGEPADARMRRHAARRGYRLESLSRPVVAADFDRFDLLIGMDQQNVADLKARCPDPASLDRISLMLDEAPELGTREVPDPYYGGEAGFEEVLDLLEVACRNLLTRLS